MTPALATTLLIIALACLACERIWGGM